MSNLKLNQHNKYYTPAGKLVLVFALTGTKEAIAQYVADQAHVVKKDGSKGCTFAVEGDPTSAPLYFSSKIGEEINRGKDGGWFINNDLEKLLLADATRERENGNTEIADAMTSAIVADRVAKAKAMLNFRSQPRVASPATASTTLDNV